MIISHKSPDKGARVNGQRQQAIAAGFIWGGHTFDVDSTSLTLIAGRALRLTIDNSVCHTEWRTKDNQMAHFTREQFLEFALAADAHIEHLYQQSWELKDAVT